MPDSPKLTKLQRAPLFFEINNPVSDPARRSEAWLLEAVVDKILLTRLNGFRGVSIFSYDSHKNDLKWFQPVIDALGSQIHD